MLRFVIVKINFSGLQKEYRYFFASRHQLLIQYRGYVISGGGFVTHIDKI